ncbi:GWxTD domain-containing protein [Williamwhitmania taraxaci]|uniref:GWxTD domain-containing protein n=1 Tax=Williamwhitmania taraxaci TaxID=1640674 RepID=A0A1G6Q5C1_9BACT|nr:GWxTD domain-containing protein [Williamwhitmania taraxaci]SDC87508.1 GWxTD domain-containing protein [Williamwhitmania taraxaci]
MLKTYRSPFRTTILIALGVVMVSCAGNRRAQQSVKLTDSYNPAANSVHPEVKVFHLNDSLSELNILFYPKEILMSTSNPDSVLRGSVRFNMELYNVKDSLVAVDTASLVVTIDQNSLRKPSMYSKLPVRATLGECYVMKFSVTDVLREQTAIVLMMVDKTNRNTGQWYRTTNPDGSVFFGMAVREGGIVMVDHPMRSLDSTYIFFYRNLSVSPPPVRAIREYLPELPDSVWKIGGKRVSFPYEGTYCISADSSQGKGLMLGRFTTGFPRRVSPNQLVESMVYIESRVTDSGFTATNSKLLLDSLWLSRTGNHEASRELIRIYYNRLFLANYYFSSYKEGWKTDRGMIFMVYGLPTRIFRYGLNEVWIYGHASGKKSTRFHFRYKPGSASPNDFVLDYMRSSNLKWSVIEDGWKKGKPFIYEEEDEDNME